MIRNFANVTIVCHPTASAPRPPQLLEVFPTENSEQASVKFVGAGFDFTLGEEAELDSLQLFVDAVDVTKQSQKARTRESGLPSNYRISYTLDAVQIGIHCAEIRFRTKDGTTKSYRWSLAIKSP